MLTAISCERGAPRTIKSDNGSEFISKVMDSQALTVKYGSGSGQLRENLRCRYLKPAREQELDPCMPVLRRANRRQVHADLRPHHHGAADAV